MSTSLDSKKSLLERHHQRMNSIGGQKTVRNGGRNLSTLIDDVPGDNTVAKTNLRGTIIKREGEKPCSSNCPKPGPEPKPPCPSKCPEPKPPCPAPEPEPEEPTCEEKLPECVQKFVDELRCNPAECDIEKIIDFFFGKASAKECPWYDYCQYTTAEIPLKTNDFAYADPELNQGPVLTNFTYAPCIAPVTTPLKLAYWPLETSRYGSDDQECSPVDLQQNPLRVQVTVPDNFRPGSPLRIKLNLIAQPPETLLGTNLGKLLAELNIDLNGTEPIDLPVCPDPEISQLQVLVDTLHLCDIRANTDLPNSLKCKCNFKDKLKMEGKSSIFKIFNYKMPSVGSLQHIQVQIDIFPDFNTQILPNDLLVLYIARTKPGSGEDTVITYGVVSGSIEYSGAPETLSEIIHGIYDPVADQCNTAIDFCLNSFTSPQRGYTYVPSKPMLPTNPGTAPAPKSSCGCNGKK